MKKLLLILLCVPLIGFGQQTYVPDDGFESRLIQLGYDNVLDDSVLTNSISGVTQLHVGSYGPTFPYHITDLTGIEDNYWINATIFRFNDTCDARGHT